MLHEAIVTQCDNKELHAFVAAELAAPPEGLSSMSK
jgi:hypothetical protein